jgi:hypothetical protein
MAEQKSLHEILAGHVGEDSASRIMQELESLARAGATGPELESALRKQLAEILLRGRVAGVTPLVGIGVFAGAGIGVGVGVGIGKKLVAPQ